MLCIESSLLLRIVVSLAAGFIGMRLAIWWHERPMRQGAWILLQERLAKEDAEAKLRARPPQGE